MASDKKDTYLQGITMKTYRTVLKSGIAHTGEFEKKAWLKCCFSKVIHRAKLLMQTVRANTNIRKI